MGGACFGHVRADGVEDSIEIVGVVGTRSRSPFGDSPLGFGVEVRGPGDRFLAGVVHVHGLGARAGEGDCADCIVTAVREDVLVVVGWFHNRRDGLVPAVREDAVRVHVDDLRCLGVSCRECEPLTPENNDDGEEGGRGHVAAIGDGDVAASGRRMVERRPLLPLK